MIDKLKEEMGPTVQTATSPEANSSERNVAELAGGLGGDTVYWTIKRRHTRPEVIMPQVRVAATRGAEILIEALRETGHLTEELDYAVLSEAMERITRGEQ